MTLKKYLKILALFNKFRVYKIMIITRLLFLNIKTNREYNKN